MEWDNYIIKNHINIFYYIVIHHNQTIKQSNNMSGKKIMSIMFMPLAFSSLHWCSAQIYMQFCAPSGFRGYIVSFFNVANPLCSYTLQVMEMSKYFYNQSWIFIGMSTLGACKHVYEMCMKQSI